MMLPRLITTAALVAASVSGLSASDIPQSMTDDIASRSKTENVADIVLEYVKNLDLLPNNTNILYRRRSPPSPAANNPAAAVATINRRADTPSDLLKNYISSIADDGRDLLYRRADTPPAPPANWNASTMAACTTALVMLRGLANSPSGMAMCYNLPFLDNSTGVFEADLRLFTIGPATGAFAGVAPADVSIDVRFAGAQVQPVPVTDLVARPQVAARGLPLSWPPSKRGLFAKRADQAPVMAQSFAFVGQINKELQNANLNSTALQAILIPVVTLSVAKNAANSSLSSLEATFVTGLFSDQPHTMATISAVGVIADVAFVLPGTKIAIVPIGGIITGTWAVLFIGVIGWGTVGRMGFRENYRRRLARADRGGEKTI
ncbi:hypothetical protein VE01_01419 [Pseudogymnoascus verrucosus]|uniref:Uncharacterized protein n=1 Tax=Pseudogymnoascus verrucosus TaxID=342668 RepID=A0A1B8GX84_9PEZI|nr:uncharacterized protein VE01_01419 [Pseudogymnoascus verrucosus]OBU00417.1 hypothetical protein VE01_01419 [Pseudogymnoascus verrucosus]